MKHWSFYSESDGYFIPRLFSSTDSDQVMANTPAGCVAIEGHFDHLSQRFDLASGEIINYRPEAPSADFEWNDDLKRWVLNNAAVARLATRQAIQDLEAKELRALREHALGLPGAMERLQELEKKIVALRADLV